MLMIGARPMSATQRTMQLNVRPDLDSTMDIDTTLRELGEIDITALRDAILAQDDSAWKEDSNRQEEYEVHHDTESIVLVFVDIDRWPEIVVSQEPGWPRLSDVALPLMNDIISRLYPPGGTVIRAMAAKLLAGKMITPCFSFLCGPRRKTVCSFGPLMFAPTG